MSRYQAWSRKALSTGRPLSAHFELTYHCNVRCRHCFQDRDAAPQELGREEWLRAVDQAREAGVLTVSLSGGEAMLSPHFWPVAERVRELGMALRVFTNGVMLDRANCRRLAGLHPSSVEVSVFSLRPEIHDDVTRAPGSLRKAIRGLVRLRRLGVRTKIKCPLVDVASGDFREVRSLAERLGSGVVFDPYIYPRFDGDQAPTRCRGDDQILYEYFVDPATLATEMRPLHPRQPSDPICGIARSFTVVAPDGRVLSCPLIQEPVGNLREQGLLQIWNESPTLLRLRGTTYGDLPVCGSCPRNAYCDRCSATALLEDGDFFGPSSRACHVAEVKERAWGVPAPAGAVPKKRKLLRVVP
jgi:radical SAM protein with 4Fe4S-binding SPASM domain